MNISTQHIPYRQTGFFSALVSDYLDKKEQLDQFYTHPADLTGIKAAVAERGKYHTNRALLVDTLRKQYAGKPNREKINTNTESLLNENTFTICTAHQPNIFTGHLYFIYKILHAIKLSDELNTAFPGQHFVPVFYMGSEDADLDELGHIYLSGEKHSWATKQTGAIGRMKVDKVLLQLIDSISGQLTVHPFGEELVTTLNACYREGLTIEQATFDLIHELFAQYGLLVLLPDNPDLKRAFIPVVEKELAEGFSHKVVAETIAAFPSGYKVQAGGRELNLFYLLDDKRERIEKEQDLMNCPSRVNWKIIQNASVRM